MAQELRRSDPSGAVLIVGRRGGVAEGLVTAAGFRLETLQVSGLDTGSAASVSRFVARLPVAVMAARRIIREFRAGVVAAAFAETAARLPRARVVHTGNPIRTEVLATPPRPLGDRCDALLVMGGSQGARRINRAVAGCVEALLRSNPSLRIVHQTGVLDSEEMEAVAASLDAVLRARWSLAPFIRDVGAAITGADLVLMRAGGSSVAECAALGRPMILVPYPHAGDHQRLNAAPYVVAGAARVIPDQECDAPRVAAELGALLDDPAAWRRMAAASAGLGRRDAASRVVGLLTHLAGSPARIPG